MKKVFLIATFLSLSWALFFMLVNFFNVSSDMPALEKQTWSLMMNLKSMTTLLFYIAWRVTPK